MANEIAKTILEQLGGRQFTVMTGSKDFVGGNDYLSFKVGRNAKSVTHVKITLDPTDTYTVEFYRIRAAKLTPIAKVSDVYVDMLQNIFETHTGLYTKLC